MILGKRTYLDYAAAYPVLPEAKDAFMSALKLYGNPSAAHTEGREAKEILDHARRGIARLSGVKKEAVIFTGNATEANALAIEGAVRARRLQVENPSAIHLLYVAGAHSSVVQTIEAMKSWGVQADALPLVEGRLRDEDLRALVRPETLLVSIELIMSETGVRIDPRAVRQVIGTSVLLHVDASQAPLIESFEHTRLAADFITLDAQKVGGVRGIGALIAPNRSVLAPILHGGGQEQGLRPGTESPALASAFMEALERAAVMREAFVTQATLMRERLLKRILLDTPTALVNEGREQAPHILNVSFPGVDTDYLVTLLDEAGFAVSTKSSCETDLEEGSRAVLALTGDSSRASSTLRISFGRDTREGELENFAKVLSRSLRFLDRASG